MGQLPEFPGRFLDALRVDTEAKEHDRAEVQTEVSIRRRLDILVSTTSLRLAIENRPWADDQDKQLTRNFAHFDTLERSIRRVAANAY